MDTSLSMQMGDVSPTRISAAQQAARNFIANLPSNARLGIVSFAGASTLVQPPTDNRQDMLEAIDRFQLQRGTATGGGLLLALATLLPDDDIDVESMLLGSTASDFEGRPVAPSLDQAGAVEAARKRERERPPMQPGSYTRGAIILLSDGRRTTGPDPLEAARLAATRGVRVYTVGFGTPQGSTVGEGGWSYFMQLDDTTLKAVAKATGGEYFQAGSSADLDRVYQNLRAHLSLERRDTEISSLLAAAAALLLVVACALSVLWFNR
jgi:Ca-activated chloride channel family protein